MTEAQTAGGHALAMALRKAYLAMHRHADAALEPFGVTANQYVVLAVLDNQDGLSQRELVERASSDANTIRPILAALQKKAFVVRNAHPADRRAWSVKLTRAGRVAFAEMRQGSDAFRHQLMEPFKASEAQSFAIFLDRVARAMTQPATQLRVKRLQGKRSTSSRQVL